MLTSIVPARGERALVCGQTGSGKTVAMCAIGEALGVDGRVVIIDTKIEPKYRSLPEARLIRDIDEAWSRETRHERRNGPATMIWRPPIELAQDPEALDHALSLLYQRYRGPIIIDELYPLHIGGRAGPGLTALLTRGRSRGITTVMGSQRPTWISRFCLTEAQHYWVYALVDRMDRKRLTEVIPEFPQDTIPPKYHFYFYSHARGDLQRPVMFSPIEPRREQVVDSEEESRGVRWF